VCGAQDARGHALKLVRRGPPARAERPWVLASDVAKDAPERTEAPPACLECDLRDGQISVAKQRRRPLDAPRQQVPMRRHAEGLHERSCEVGRRDAADARQPLDRPALVRAGVHPVLRAQQAAQQPRILARGVSARLNGWRSTAFGTGRFRARDCVESCHHRIPP
jgi:hypothetical protein